MLYPSVSQAKTSLGGFVQTPHGGTHLDLGDFLEVCRVRNLETSHAESMSPLLREVDGMNVDELRITWKSSPLPWHLSWTPLPQQKGPGSVAQRPCDPSRSSYHLWQDRVDKITKNNVEYKVFATYGLFTYLELCSWILCCHS